MEQSFIPDSKIYEMALDHKNHHEDRRDAINNYYISLFAAIIAAIPFIDKIASGQVGRHALIVKASLAVLALIGIVLAFTWVASLKRTLYYLQSLDKIIIELEKKYSKFFLSKIIDELHKKNAPGRITKNQIVIPYCFIAIFLAILAYAIYGSFMQNGS